MLLELLGAALAIAAYVLGFVNGAYYTEHKSEAAVEHATLSDEEIIELRVMDNYGPEYYGVLSDDNNDDYIDYLVYSEDNVLCYVCSSDREVYQIKYASK